MTINHPTPPASDSTAPPASGYRRLAGLVRRVPVLMALAHRGYRLFQPKFSVGVAGVIFNTQGQVLLAEHVFHPRYPWGLPGGWIDRHEQPHEGVVREIREELALAVAIEHLLLGEITLPKHIDFAYLCRIESGSQIGQLSNELLAYAWVDPHDTPPLLIFHRRAINRALEIRTLLAGHRVTAPASAHPDTPTSYSGR